MRQLRFKGCLNETDRNTLKKSGVIFKDDKQPTSGLAALRDGLNSAVDWENPTMDQATKSKDRITIIRAAKTPTSELLKLVTETHSEDDPVQVLVDDNTDVDSHRRTDFEEAVKVMEESGVKVYRSVEEILDEDKRDTVGGFENNTEM